MYMNKSTSEQKLMHEKTIITNLKCTIIYSKEANGDISLYKMATENQVEYCKAWQPVVTSTPFKKIPKTADCFNERSEIKNQKLKNSKSKFENTISFLNKDNDRNKKINKKKSSIYFDASSSSDEDSIETNNNSGIKINFEPHRKSVLKSKKFLNKNRNVKSRRKVRELNTSEKNIYKNSATRINNSFNISEISKSFQSKIDSINTRDKDSTSASKSEKQIKGNIEKPLRKENSKGNNICEAILSKRKSCKQPGFISKKKVKKNLLESPITYKSSAEIIADCITPVNAQNKKNSSHQLFSDIKEQELIDSLDLTKSDDDIFTKDFDSSQRKNKNTSKIKKDKVFAQKAVSNSNLINEKKQRRSLRQRQAPKEFWLPANELSSENLVMNKSVKQQNKINKNLSETNFLIEKEDKLPVLVDPNEIKKTFYDNKNGTLTESCELKRINCSSANEKNVVNNCNEEYKKVCLDVIDIAEKEAVDLLKSNCGKIRKKHQSDKLIKKESHNNLKVKKKKINHNNENSGKTKNIEVKTDCCQQNSMVSDTFKHFSELTDFVETQQGCFARVCWSFRNYKCGIVKISSNSTLFNKTKFDNSYFGGVLIKGSLKMKIGESEVVLEEWDTVCVPPLTEWSAKNVCESESSFYFWCGRFKG